MKTVAVDFDGVIHGYSRGWCGGEIYDPPIPGTKEGMQRLLDLGYQVVVYSTRCYDRTFRGTFEKNQVAEMATYMSKHEIPFTRIHTEPGKPICTLFIDDRAYRFCGDWNDELSIIESFL